VLRADFLGGFSHAIKLGCRKSHSKNGILILFTVDVNRTAEFVDDPLADYQTKPCPRNILSFRSFGAIKLLK
jgi:hypothetical protein